MTIRRAEIWGWVLRCLRWAHLMALPFALYVPLMVVSAMAHHPGNQVPGHQFGAFVFMMTVWLLVVYGTVVPAAFVLSAALRTLFFRSPQPRVRDTRREIFADWILGYGSAIAYLAVPSLLGWRRHANDVPPVPVQDWLLPLLIYGLLIAPIFALSVRLIRRLIDEPPFPAGTEVLRYRQ